MLRRLLTFLGVPVWKHFYTGLSRMFLNGIDMYMKTLSPPMRSVVGQRAHYVLNVSRPWYDRQRVSQENWYICRDWLFYDQMDPMFDTGISDPGLLQLTRAIADNPHRGMTPLLFFFVNLCLCVSLGAGNVFHVCCCLWKRIY